MAAASNGNNPKAWEKFLETLDDRLQFGLLTQIKNAISYHFEEATLYLEFENQSAIDYLSKDAMNQQLQILAKDILCVRRSIFIIINEKVEW